MSGHAAVGQAPGCDISLDIAYGPLPAQSLDVYRPSMPAPGGPAVLLLHGGGWRTGDKSRFADTAPGFAQAGILAVSANYRLSTGDSDTRWPAQLDDAEAALAWLSANAPALGADPARICVMGASAGGHLALFAGLPPMRPGQADRPRAAGIISVSGPIDLPSMMKMRASMIRNLVGGTDPKSVHAAAAAASPLSHIRPGASPVLLIYGIADAVVPFDAAPAYQAALAQADVPAWLLSHTGGHLMKGAPRPARLAIQQAQTAFILKHRLDTPPGRQDLA